MTQAPKRSVDRPGFRTADLQRAVFSATTRENRPEPVLELICRHIEDRFPGSHCCVMLLSPADQCLRLAAAPSLPSPLRETLDTLPADTGPGLAPIAASSGAAESSSALEEDPRWRPLRDEIRAARVRSACSIAILGTHLEPRAGGPDARMRVLGTLDLYLPEPGGPSEAQLTTLELAAVLASAAIQALDSKERIRRQRSFDQVTGLPNRRLFGVELERALEDAHPRHDRLALLLLDFDQFKVLNDTVGYAIGDALLRATADRLSDLRRPGDLVARLGDDDFAVLMAEAGESGAAEERARRILDTLRVPFDFGGHPLVVTASAGLSLYPWDGSDATTLFRNAEKALHEAKRRGRNCLQHYAATLGSIDFDTLELKTSLHLALDEGELGVGFQPIVEAGTGAVHAAEALVHWNHPRRGRLAPSHFIPLAEETGLISQVGDQVLQKACAEAAGWREIAGRPVHLTVNVSAQEFQDRGFVRRVRDALAHSELAGSSLVLELTERTVMADIDRATKILRQLDALGVRIALDDFGTGYSSMAQLKRFAIHWLKIDRSFVRGLPYDADNRALARAILAMAKALRLTVVAEGIESPEEAAFLTTEGCELLQGFHFSLVLPKAELERTLANGLEETADQTREEA